MTELIKLLDGKVVDIEINKGKTLPSCDTCDYGSEYIREITVKFEDHKKTVEILNEYELPTYSMANVFKLLFNNFERFESITKEKFFEEFVKDIKKSVNEDFSIEIY